MRVVRGEHFPGLRVGHQPGECGEVRDGGGSAVGPGMGAGAVEQGRLYGRRPGAAGWGGFRGDG